MNIVETAANTPSASVLPAAGGFAAPEPPITCTPAAIDLAGIGFGAAGFGYLAARAFYHKHVHHGGHFADDIDDVRFPGEASADELIRYRAG